MQKALETLESDEYCYGKCEFCSLLQDVKEWYIGSMLSHHVWIFFKASVHHMSNMSRWGVPPNFWMNFQTVSKFGIVAVRLILPKVGIDGFTGLTGKRCQIKKRFFTHIKNKMVEMEILLPFFCDFLKRRWFTIACDRLILGKVGVDGFTGPGHETDYRMNLVLKV